MLETRITVKFKIEILDFVRAVERIVRHVTEITRDELLLQARRPQKKEAARHYEAAIESRTLYPFTMARLQVLPHVYLDIPF
jgi:hypothetical protein